MSYFIPFSHDSQVNFACLHSSCSRFLSITPSNPWSSVGKKERNTYRKYMLRSQHGGRECVHLVCNVEMQIVYATNENRRFLPSDTVWSAHFAILHRSCKTYQKRYPGVLTYGAFEPETYCPRKQYNPKWIDAYFCFIEIDYSFGHNKIQWYLHRIHDVRTSRKSAASTGNSIRRAIAPVVSAMICPRRY